MHAAFRRRIYYVIHIYIECSIRIRCKCKFLCVFIVRSACNMNIFGGYRYGCTLITGLIAFNGDGGSIIVIFFCLYGISGTVCSYFIHFRIQ